MGLSIPRFFRRYFWLSALLFWVAIVIVANLQAGVWLTGWDTLHPEVDFSLNLSRLLGGMWRGEQGLGAPAGHSHMADLPRVLFMWLLSPFLPVSWLRPLSVFVYLILGVLGAYVLAGYLEKSTRKSMVGFVAGMVYLFNFATVQQFFVPFEMFPAQYGTLPWLIYWMWRYLEEGKRRNLVWLGVWSFLAAPQAYAAHLWYATFGVLSICLLVYGFLYRHRAVWLKIISVLGVIVITNLFWLFPNIYYVRHFGNVPSESKQNRIFSYEFLLRNRETGRLKDVALLRGFYADWPLYNFEEQQVEPLMKIWNDHMGAIGIKLIGYLVFIVGFLGIGVAIRHRDMRMVSLIPLMVIPLILLLNRTFLFEQLFDGLLIIGLFQEGLRFVFNKFATILALGLALFFASFLATVFRFIPRWGRLVGIGGLVVGLVFYMKPLFYGQLISDAMQLSIPVEYGYLWDFMKDQPKERTLLLPLHSFSGWQYNTWGYQGAGFVWFGLSQPVLNRDFDRWYTPNEQAYREFQHALYSLNPRLFRAALEKYRVGYLVVDTSVTDADFRSAGQKLFGRETILLLEQIDLVERVEKFGHLEVYRVGGERSDLELLTGLPTIGPGYMWSFEDQGYSDFGDYISSVQGDVNYSWRTLLSGTDRLPEGETDRLVADFGAREHAIILDADDITRTISDEGGKTSGVIVDGGLRYESIDGVTGDSINLPLLAQDIGYLVGVTGRNEQGLPLRICVQNLYSKICDIYDELPFSHQITTSWFVLPPMHLGSGFQLHMTNLSYGQNPSINVLQGVQFVPFGYDEAIRTKHISRSFVAQEKNREVLSGENEGNAGGVVRLARVSDDSVLFLNKAYEPNWKAYENRYQKSDVRYRLTRLLPFIFGKELKEHVLVNNWANGWRLDGRSQMTDNGEIVIYYLPQVLEWIGLGLLGVIVLWGMCYGLRGRRMSRRLHRNTGAADF